MLFSSLYLTLNVLADPISPDPRGMAGPDRNFDLHALVWSLPCSQNSSVFGTATLEVERLYEEN